MEKTSVDNERGAIAHALLLRSQIKTRMPQGKNGKGDPTVFLSQIKHFRLWKERNNASAQGASKFPTGKKGCHCDQVKKKKEKKSIQTGTSTQNNY